MDTRADTTCAGANFHLHCLTGQTCSVAPFSDKYTPIQDVPIATCFTAYTDEHGKTFILEFNEVLWFGTQMDHSLINPNQIRVTGIPLSDNPFDKTKELGIESDQCLIPFNCDGTTIFFNTQVPTNEEIECCEHITMTEETEWNPSTVRLSAVRTTEEESFRKIAAIARKPPSCVFETDSALLDCSPVFLKSHSLRG